MGMAGPLASRNESGDTIMRMWFLAAVCGLAAFAAQPGYAQTVNNVPTLLSRSNGSNSTTSSILSYMAKFLGFGTANNTPSTSALGQGTNAFNLPSNTPIASPMYVNRGSNKLSDFFFKPANNTIISNSPTIGRSYFPTQAQLPGRAYLNQFGYTNYAR